MLPKPTALPADARTKPSEPLNEFRELPYVLLSMYFLLRCYRLAKLMIFPQLTNNSRYSFIKNYVFVMFFVCIKPNYALKGQGLR